MRAKGPRYKKASVVGVKKIVSTMSVERKRKPSVHPAGNKKKKNTIQTMTPVDCDPVVGEVVEDTRAAVEEMMKELNDMVEQSTPALTVMYDTAEDKERKSVDYMVCPCHDVRLEARESQKGWKYVKCPMQPCLLFCGQDQALEYMKAVYSQPHVEVFVGHVDLFAVFLPGTRHAATEPFDPEPRSLVSELFQETVWLLPMGRSTHGPQVLELVS